MNLKQKYWHSRSPDERRRLALAGVIILVLIAWLLGQQLLNWKQNGERWQQLSQQSGQLLLSVPMQEADWRQLLQQHDLLAQELSPVGDGWQLRGQGMELEAVQRLVSDASARGWYSRDWQLDNRGDEVQFAFLFQAINLREGSI